MDGFTGVTSTPVDPSAASADTIIDTDLGLAHTLGGPAAFAPRRVDDSSWELAERFAYIAESGDTFIVPKDLETFGTDLTSIPWVFAWLVPSNGPHVPGVLLHDGLVCSEGREPCPSHFGPEVDRVEADRLLREANRRCGTPFLQRWLIWTGVMLATLKTVWPPLRWWATIVGFFGAIALTGLVATVDLFDVDSMIVPVVDWSLPTQLPWMGSMSWWAELGTGASAALVLPVIASIVFGRHWRVGAIGGAWVGMLLHATIAVAATYSFIQLLERGARTLGLR